MSPLPRIPGRLHYCKICHKQIMLHMTSPCDCSKNGKTISIYSNDFKSIMEQNNKRKKYIREEKLNRILNDDRRTN